MAILDGVGKNANMVYHPKNTMCAIFYQEKLSSTVLMKWNFKKFTIDIKTFWFNKNSQLA